MKFVIPILITIATLGRSKVINTGYDNSYKQADAGYAAPTNDYAPANKYETKCTPYYETQTEDRCEHYTEKVCTTTHKASCGDIQDKTCKGIVSGKQFRKCFDVNDLLCSLKEDVRHDVVQAVFTVQKCHKVTERVCDTMHETRLSTKADFQCIKVYNPHCHSEEKTFEEKTCRTITNFDCSQDSYAQQDSGYGSDSGYDSNAREGYSSGGYSSQDSYAREGYSSGGYEQQGYAEPKCKRTYDTKCYTTPRTVMAEKCETKEDKICEKLAERVPMPAERQVCHDEVKKVCELEQRSQPKQIKKYVYTKQCKSVPRKICENADSKTLVPSCVPTTRKECTYSPVEKCDDVPKKHCYKIHKKIKKQRCETVMASGYGQKDSGYGQASGYARDEHSTYGRDMHSYKGDAKRDEHSYKRDEHSYKGDAKRDEHSYKRDEHSYGKAEVADKSGYDSAAKH